MSTTFHKHACAVRGRQGTADLFEAIR